MKDKNLAVVLVSGGMDSAVVASLAKEQHEQLAFIHTNYGQKTHKKELECFHNLADFFNVPSKLRKIVDLTFLSSIGGSSLTDTAIEVTKFEGDTDIIPSSYVPFRNTIILSMAVSWAEVLGAKKIYIGANYEDSPGYPDCRPSYYDAFNNLIKEGTKEVEIKIETPVLYMKKKEIVETAQKLSTPLELTWSCYARSDKACGVCDSCALRLRGFKEANITDPIDYI